MGLIKGVSTFLWLLLAYVFAKYAAVYLDMPTLNMNYVLWAENEQFFIRTQDAFLIVGVFFLFIEIYKSATGGPYTVPETIVSFFVALAYMVIFLLWHRAHTIDFFILMCMAFIDAIGGFVISNNAARRDISVG